MRQSISLLCNIDTSAASGIGIHVVAPPTSSAPTYNGPSEKTPSPNGTGMFPQPLISPSSNMSINSMVSPTTPGSVRFERPLSLESSGVNGHFDSRRESVDSRFNQGFGEMKLGGNSPYTSHNQSTSSIPGALAQHRHPRSGVDNLSVHRISNGYQPNAERNPQMDMYQKTIRTAPVISGPTTSTIARAAEPTKGQGWAFPDEEIPRMPSVAGNNYYDSRRSSITESIASSQFTEASRLPPGQRRLDDGLGVDYQRLSTASADFPAVHHHSLQHKQLSDLQSEEGSPQNGTQPYSRTPELRVSHKLAERKRRTEMKELFEQLRDLMPQERGSKASKWEILTKGTFVHKIYMFLWLTALQQLLSTKNSKITSSSCLDTARMVSKKPICCDERLRCCVWRMQAYAPLALALRLHTKQTTQVRVRRKPPMTRIAKALRDRSCHPFVL